MNYLEINLKDGLIVVNKQPISIFFMNDFIKNLSYINEVYNTPRKLDQKIAANKIE